MDAVVESGSIEYSGDTNDVVSAVEVAEGADLATYPVVWAGAAGLCE